MKRKLSCFVEGASSLFDLNFFGFNKANTNNAQQVSNNLYGDWLMVGHDICTSIDKFKVNSAITNKHESNETRRKPTS